MKTLLKLLIGIVLVLNISNLSAQSIDDVFPYDKRAHALAGMTASGMTYMVSYDITRNKNKAMWLGFTSAFLLGTSKEIYDSTLPYNRFDVKDFLTTFLSGVITTIVLRVTINLE